MKTNRSPQAQDRYERDAYLAEIYDFDALVTENLEAAKSIAWHITKKYGDYSLYDDILSEVYLSMVRAAKYYNPEKETSFLTFVSYISLKECNRFVNAEWKFKNNTCTKLINKNNEESDALDAVTSTDYNEMFTIDELLLFLDTDQEKEVITHLFIDNKTLQKTASEMGISKCELIQIREQTLIKLKEIISELECIVSKRALISTNANMKKNRTTSSCG